MARTDAKLHILLICPWVTDTCELRDAISAAGYVAKLRRVDFEAALRAALSLGRFDVAAYVPTPGLKRDAVRSILREHAPTVTLVATEVVDELAGEIVRTLARRSS